MLKIRSAIAIAVLCSAQFALANIDPSLKLLKPYRTYFVVKEDLGSKHKFSVHVNVGSTDKSRHTTCQFVGTNNEDIELIRCGNGLFASAFPEDQTPFPKDLNPRSEKVRSLLLKTPSVEGSEDFIIEETRYEGFARRIKIRELTVTSENDNVKKTKSADVRYILAVDTDQKAVMEPDGFGFGRGFGELCRRKSFDDENPCAGNRKFVDYVMSPSIEGSSFIGMASEDSRQKMPEIYKKEWDNFVKRAVKAADAIATGSYKNQIQSVVNQQGDSKLPSSFNLQMRYEVNYSYNTDKETVRSDIVFFLPVAGFVNQQTSSYDYSNADVQIKLTMDGKQNIHVQFFGGQKELKKLTLTYDFREEDLIRDGANFGTEAIFGKIENGPYFGFDTSSGRRITGRISGSASMSPTFLLPDSDIWTQARESKFPLERLP